MSTLTQEHIDYLGSSTYSSLDLDNEEELLSRASEIQTVLALDGYDMPDRDDIVRAFRDGTLK